MPADVVALEVAVAMRTLGYPQDEWPQLCYIARVIGEPLDPEDAVLRYIGGPGGEQEWLAAPSVLTALTWLEERYGWEYMRAYDDWGHLRWQARHQAEREQIVYADTPSALLQAITRALLARRASEEG